MASRKDRLGALALSMIVLVYAIISLSADGLSPQQFSLNTFTKKDSATPYKSMYKNKNQPSFDSPGNPGYQAKKNASYPLDTALYPSPKNQHPPFNREPKRQYHIELNQADSAALEKLPGIGPVLASRIIRYREKLGGFYSKVQLREVYGISDTLYNLLEPMTEVLKSENNLIKLNINLADLEHLRQHPYLRWEKAKAIVRYREANGSFRSVTDLQKIRTVDSLTLQKLLPYLTLSVDTNFP